MRILQDVLQDVSYGLRMFARTPGFTVAVVVTLGLGIGASTSIFTVVNAVILRPLPYPEPDRLVYVKEDLGPSGVNPLVSSREFVAWKQQSRTLSHLAGYISSGANLTGGDQSERVICGKVTASFLPLLGVQPIAGRSFVPEDDRPESPPVAILSHALWQRRFGGDPSVIGRTLALDATHHTIVGVLPATFQVPDRYNMRQQGYDVWIPFALSETAPAFTLMRAIGRLAPGASLEAARVELDTLLQPTVRKGRTKHVVLPRWHDEIAGGARRSLWLFLAAAGFVLLIACVNVANLLLSRAAVREREMAIRLALGAARPRILRQLLAESLLLSLSGALLGLALAFWGTDLLMAVIAVNLPIVDPVGLDYRVLGLTAGLAVLAGLAFGLASALQASSLRRSRRRLPSLLVVVEAALAMVVLIGAGLLARSFLLLRGIDPGFRSDGLLTVAVHLAPARYPAAKDQSAYFQQAIQRLESLPGVDSVSAVSSLPLGLYSASMSTVMEGRPDSPVSSSLAAVSPDYFRTLGMPFLRGRALTDGDREGSPGAIVVNQSFVRHYCPGEECVGKRIASWIRKGDWLTVVGVAGDVRDDPERQPSPAVYASYLQAGEPMMYLVLRATGDPAALAAAARRRIASVDSEQPSFDVMTLNDRLAAALAPQRANALLLGALAVVAVMLGSIGIYGVVSYAVSQRTREIGVRIALGAGHRRVLSLVVTEYLVLVGIGEACGVVAAWALSRMMSSLVFQIATTDAPTYAAAAAAWTGVALVACCIPARRAMFVNPVVALRAE